MAAAIWRVPVSTGSECGAEPSRRDFSLMWQTHMAQSVRLSTVNTAERRMPRLRTRANFMLDGSSWLYQYNRMQHRATACGVFTTSAQRSLVGR